MLKPHKSNSEMAKPTHKFTTPFETVLPPLTDAQFKSLRQRIRDEGGVRDRVLVSEQDEVLDGHHRLKIDPSAPTAVVVGSGKWSVAQKEAFIFRTSQARRSLSPEQVLDIIKPIILALQKEGKTQSQIGQMLGIDQATVSRWVQRIRNTMQQHNTSPLDLRVKIPAATKPDILDRVDAGESPRKVASEYQTTPRRVQQIVTSERKEREKEAAQAKKRKRVEKVVVDGFSHGDFREVAKAIPDNAVDLIFTDPPYDRKSVSLYGDLAEIGTRVLCEGGSLVCYCGQYLVPDILQRMTPHLRFWWMCAKLHPGDQARMREYGIIVTWKPLLWFVKDTRGDKSTWVEDSVSHEKDKEHHKWGQSLDDAIYYTEKLTGPNGFVWDPFCGGGTTALACKRLGRPFLTCDTDKKALDTAKARFVDDEE